MFKLGCKVKTNQSYLNYYKMNNVQFNPLHSGIVKGIGSFDDGTFIYVEDDFGNLRGINWKFLELL